GMQLPNYTTDDYVSAFGKMFADLAAKDGAALVPYLLRSVAGDPSLNLSDRIHPNPAGQKILAETVWQVLEPVAREVASRQEPPLCMRHDVGAVNVSRGVSQSGTPTVLEATAARLRRVRFRKIKRRWTLH